VEEAWASSGLTDIHHQELRLGRKDVHHRDHEAEAVSPSVVHAGVQGGDRGAVSGGGDRTVGQVAEDFDLTETAVRTWVSQAETKAGQRLGLTSDELARLRRENRSLREDAGVLERATSFLRRGPGEGSSLPRDGKSAGHGVAVRAAC
jgi:transposase-like protein